MTSNESSIEIADKLISVATCHDATCDGKFKRLIVGERGALISGAIYLDTTRPLPRAIILNLHPDE